MFTLEHAPPEKHQVKQLNSNAKNLQFLLLGFGSNLRNSGWDKALIRWFGAPG